MSPFPVLCPLLPVQENSENTCLQSIELLCKQEKWNRKLNKEDVLRPHQKLSFLLKKGEKVDRCNKMDGPWRHNVQRNVPLSESQRLYASMSVRTWSGQEHRMLWLGQGQEAGSYYLRGTNPVWDSEHFWIWMVMMVAQLCECA